MYLLDKFNNEKQKLEKNIPTWFSFQLNLWLLPFTVRLSSVCLSRSGNCSPHRLLGKLHYILPLGLFGHLCGRFCVAPSHKNQNVMLLPACLGQFLGRFSSDFPFKWDSLPSDPNMLSLRQWFMRIIRQNIINLSNLIEGKSIKYLALFRQKFKWMLQLWEVGYPSVCL